MRVTALALLLALLFPAAAAVASGADAFCCCKMKAGATCPLKRKASACGESGALTCGIQRSEPVAAVIPLIGDFQSAVLVERRSVTIPTAATVLIARSIRVGSRSLKPPEPPPPRVA